MEFHASVNGFVSLAEIPFFLLAQCGKETINMSPTLKLFLDMAPLAAFFIGYQLGDVFLATALIMLATVLSVGIGYLLERKLALNPLLTGLLVLLFGGLTLYLQDDYFIKIKPTIINLLFAVILIGGAIMFKRGLLRYLLEMAFQMPEPAWRILSLRWGYFFIFLALLNEIIWRSFSTDFWVNFKVFGMFTCTIAFSIAQIPFIKRHIIAQSE